MLQPLAVRMLQPVWQQSSTKVTAERMRNGVDKFSESLWKVGGCGAVVWARPPCSRQACGLVEAARKWASHANRVLQAAGYDKMHSGVNIKKEARC